jgi:uncharacterized protein YjbI with pentapeptide repeats
MVCQVNYTNDGSLKCQFDSNPIVPQQYYSFSEDGLSWCWLHLPLEDRQGKKSQKYLINEINAKAFSEVIDRIIQRVKEDHKKTADLSYVIFPTGSKVDFSQEVHLNLSHCQFHCEVEILGKNLTIDFRNAEFFSTSSFEGNSFTSSFFDDVVFHHVAFFNKSYFVNCSFSNSKFRKGAFFALSKFSILNTKNTFNDTEFFEDCVFVDTMFDGEISFENSKFLGNTNFSCRRPLDEPFRIKTIIFKGASFNKLNFTNRTFTAKTDFSDCTFNEAPLFYGCNFHHYTLFPPQDKFKDISSEESVGAYRALNLAMATLKARQEEAMFYGLYQESQRRTKKMNHVERFISRCYKIFSNYGQSIARPIYSLLITFIVASLVYGIYLTPSKFKFKIDWHIVDKSLYTAFLQIVKPFSINSLDNFFGSPNGFIRFVASFQSLLSIVFIALLLLAIRWKFKRD